MTSPIRQSLLLLLIAILSTNSANALRLPFLSQSPPSNISITSLDYPNPATLKSLSTFFVSAFWSSKTPNPLTPSQKSYLQKSQTAEFEKRYRFVIDPPPLTYFGPSTKTLKTAALIQATSSATIAGMVGVEVDDVVVDGAGKSRSVPVLSNLAIGEEFRRQGIAELLVKRAEQVAGKAPDGTGWGFPDMYLRVEQANKPAVNLYKKLGYKTEFVDDEATTLVPTDRGVTNKDTVVLVMKKSLKDKKFLFF